MILDLLNLPYDLPLIKNLKNNPFSDAPNFNLKYSVVEISEDEEEAEEESIPKTIQPTEQMLLDSIWDNKQLFIEFVNELKSSDNPNIGIEVLQKVITEGGKK